MTIEYYEKDGQGVLTDGTGHSIATVPLSIAELIVRSVHNFTAEKIIRHSFLLEHRALSASHPEDTRSGWCCPDCGQSLAEYKYGYLLELEGYICQGMTWCDRESLRNHVARHAWQKQNCLDKREEGKP